MKQFYCKGLNNEKENKYCEGINEVLEEILDKKSAHLL